MIQLRHKLLIYALRIFDQALLVITLGLIVDVRGRQAGSIGVQQVFTEAYQPIDGLGIALLAIGWLFIFNTLVRYDSNRFVALVPHLIDVLKASAAASFYLLMIASIFEFGRINNNVVAFFWITTSMISVLSRLLMRWLLVLLRRSGYNRRHLLIIGINKQARDLAARIEASPELGYKIVGYISEPGSDSNPTAIKPMGTIAELKGILEQGTVDEMMLCIPLAERFPAVAQVIRLAEELGVVARFIPDAETSRVIGRANIERFDKDFVVTLFREQLIVQLLAKRLLDLFGSFILLVILAPLLLAVSTVIKISSPGPVFFVQERIGMNKRRFRLYKFRSMVVDAPELKAKLAALNEMDGPVFKVKNDPRITPIGRFIRKTSIDELPQLLNVLAGQMSLVGPRPPLPEEVDKYDWLYRKRLSIKPGLTCLWQISGRNNITFKRWMEMDREYIENWSFWLDLKILLKTIPVVLLGKGAS